MNRAVSRLLACVVVSCVVGMSPARADDARLPVPLEFKVEDSLGLIRDAYETDYLLANSSGEPEQLIAQLCTAAGQEADPVRKYALLLEAENVAAAHDNYRKAVELLDARAELFRIDGLALKGDLLKRLAGPKVTADLELCDQAMDTAREAMRSDRFGVASDAASLAVSIAKAIDREQKAAARKLRRPDGRNVVAPAPIGVELVKKATALQSQVTATEKSFEQYESATEKAKAAPDDPAANAVIGSYLCFVRGDWKAGLPALAKSNHPKFASLAAAELKLAAATGPMDPQQAFALAGKWWSAAESKGVSDEREAAIKDHAAGFYAAIVDRLEGALEKKLAGSRLRGLANREAGLASSTNPSTEGRVILNTQDNAQLGERRKWVEDNGNRTFQRDADSLLWREYGRDGRSGFVFKQTAVTPDYVEIVDEGRNMVCRIRKDVFEWTTRDKPDSWNFMANGRWQTDQAANQKQSPKNNQNDVPHGLTFAVEPGGVVITGYTGTDPAVTIPQIIQGRPVIAIGKEAFKDNATLTRVVLPRGLIRIDGAAFQNCRQLTEVVIPEGVRTIHNDAFLETAIESLSLPATLEVLGDGNLPDQLESISVAASSKHFRSIDGILYDAKAERVLRCPQNRKTPVVLPASVFTIEPTAFEGCSGIESIALPASLVSIGFDAFHSCTRLRTIEIPPRVSNIHGGGWCFLHSSDLEAINVDPANATYTSVDGLLYDKNVTTLLGCPGGKTGTVVIPSTVKTINGWVFLECIKLEKIVIPDSVTEISENAFKGCNAERTRKK